VFLLWAGAVQEVEMGVVKTLVEVEVEVEVSFITQPQTLLQSHIPLSLELEA
jgi:hypothetical protein